VRWRGRLEWTVLEVNEMAEGIKIKTAGIEFKAELNDTPCAKAILEALPIKGSVNRWGQEIYFAIPVSCELEAGSREVMEKGEMGYWPNGKAFCIFFGPTPASRGDEIRAASAVNVIGKVTGDLSRLEEVSDGAEISVERA